MFITIVGPTDRCSTTGTNPRTSNSEQTQTYYTAQANVFTVCLSIQIRRQNHRVGVKLPGVDWHYIRCMMETTALYSGKTAGNACPTNGPSTNTTDSAGWIRIYSKEVFKGSTLEHDPDICRPTRKEGIQEHFTLHSAIRKISYTRITHHNQSLLLRYIRFRHFHV